MQSMKFEKAQIVRSLKGHDAGELFCVMSAEENALLLADGKGRKVINPKRKNPRHAVPVSGWKHPTIDKLRSGQSIGDGELRKALAQIRDQMEV